jgi:leucyl/phenylalanyl-tRNA--protein transferase
MIKVNKKIDSFPHLDLDVLLNSYMNGIFPMAESKIDESIFWVKPKLRGILPLDSFHTSKSLKRHIQKNRSIIKFNENFDLILNGCRNRKDTWINSTLSNTYKLLFKAGHAQSIEVFESNKLVGGLFGININGAFFGESMYSNSPNASKVALKFLIERLNKCGYSLFDTQFISDHLITLGAIEITQNSYLTRLDKALKQEVKYAFY